MKKILIANRGEIAVRIARTCGEMAIPTVAVYSEADASSPHVHAADEAECIGASQASDSYLDIGAILSAARRTGADAVHPGYGFLSENARFARMIHDAGLTFIGPSPESLSRVGNKIFARQTAAKLGVPVIPALETPSADQHTLREEVRAVGYPLLVKAAAGGGGKGMRVVREETELADAVAAARREARSAFADDTVYLERYLERPRHVEVQLLGDHTGALVHLGERECSIQRRYQKIIEESPSPALTAPLRARITRAALTVAKAAGYYNAGTVEFILDSQGNFYFLEVNARLQVEHPITEWRTGLDLVREQIRIASGEPLGFRQDDIRFAGHAIECRVYAEDPGGGFLPSPGTVLAWHPPSGPGIRVDAGVEAGSEVSVYYDPMLAKISTWADTREHARRRMLLALRRTALLGPVTNLEFLGQIVDHPAFVAGRTHTGFLTEHFPNWQAGARAHLLEASLVVALSRRQPPVGSLPADGTQTPWEQLGAWRLNA